MGLHSSLCSRKAEGTEPYYPAEIRAWRLELAQLGHKTLKLYILLNL
jgi:hypothetical protein